MTDSIRVLLADDHYVIRKGLAAILKAAGGFQVIGQARNGREAVTLFDELKPDVAIIDLRMPALDGIETIAAIIDRHPDARLVALTNYEGDEDIQRCLDAGAWTYVLKKSADEQLPDMLRAVAAGQRRLPPEVATLLANRRPRSELTSRELDVLRLVAAGKANKEIATTLKVSVSTVNAHVASILRKLGVDDRTQAVVLALQRGIVHLDGVS